jgi:hypothetical protein
MRRRDFIKVIVGSAATWPLAALAQQGEHMRRIGVLMKLGADDPEAPAWSMSAFGVKRTCGKLPSTNWFIRPQNYRAELGNECLMLRVKPT